MTRLKRNQPVHTANRKYLALDIQKKSLVFLHLKYLKEKRHLTAPLLIIQLVLGCFRFICGSKLYQIEFVNSVDCSGLHPPPVAFQEALPHPSTPMSDPCVDERPMRPLLCRAGYSRSGGRRTAALLTQELLSTLMQGARASPS